MKHPKTLSIAFQEHKVMLLVRLSDMQSATYTVVEEACKKLGGLKYSAPDIDVYVLMIFTGSSLKGGGALAPLIPPPMYTYSCWVSVQCSTNHSLANKRFSGTNKENV